jgi:hypothetical protein
LTRCQTASGILGSLNTDPTESQNIWWKQIPAEFCTFVGSRFREISFRFGDAKIVQKILPTQFSIESPFPEPSDINDGENEAAKLVT